VPAIFLLVYASSSHELAFIGLTENRPDHLIQADLTQILPGWAYTETSLWD
jgi:hypothetical protein